MPSIVPTSPSLQATADLPAQLWDSLFTDKPQHRLAAGGVLFKAGDVGDGCYRLEHGLLKVQMDSPAGEQRIISLLSPGAVVGELSLIDGLPRSATVIAFCDSKLSFISREAFERHVSNRPETFQTLAAVLSMRLRETDATIAALSFLSVRGRVARALLELAKQSGKDVGDGRIAINITVSQADLAAMAGTARENVIRVFTDFRKRKVVSVLDPGIRLDNIAALESELSID